MNKLKDQKRNMNPTKEARLAMIVWSNEYGKQNGGSMDFWDSLSFQKKKQLEEWVIQIVNTA